jgi:alpha-L-arabinofuranosidase
MLSQNLGDYTVKSTLSDVGIDGSRMASASIKGNTLIWKAANYCDQAVDVMLVLKGLKLKTGSHATVTTLTSAQGKDAMNSFDEPSNVHPVTVDSSVVMPSELSVPMPEWSVVVVRVALM